MKHSYRNIFIMFLTTFMALTTIFSAFTGGQVEAKRASSNVELLGAGATFPYPLYSKMFNEYNKLLGVKVNYQAIGSGGGIRQLLSKTVDFGGTDAFMSDKELAKSDGQILHIPTCLGAVVITYNLPGSPKLKLTSEIIVDAFLGKIQKWNDMRIKALNPGVNLPDLKINIVHRSDGSGTTFIFSDYLSKVSKVWDSRIGRGKALNWPVGVGGKGNPGVAGLVKQTNGAMGYVELIYALQNKMPYALIKNKSGNFIEPSLGTVSLAANISIPADTRVSITNTDAAKGYPISSFTWIIFYKEQNYNNRSLTQAKELLSLLWWIEHDGQKYNETLEYARLPEAAVKKAETILNSVVYNGKKIDFKH